MSSYKFKAIDLHRTYNFKYVVTLTLPRTLPFNLFKTSLAVQIFISGSSGKDPTGIFGTKSTGNSGCHLRILSSGTAGNFFLFKNS